MADGADRVVRIFTAPDVSCGGGATWGSTVAALRERLQSRVGSHLVVEHVEVFSPRFFECPDIVELVRQGAALPIVTFGSQIVSQGAKISESRIRQAIEAAGASEAGH